MSQEKVIKAMLFAADKHKFQRRKSDGSSYIVHPFGVYKRLVNAGVYDTDVLVAAILHDTVEDTDTTMEEINENFGSRVASIVDQVTDDKSLSKDKRKRLQIAHAPSKSKEAKLVKLADKLDNMSGFFKENGIPQGWSRERVQGYIVWAWTVISCMRGINSKLEAQLDELFKSTLVVDGVEFVALPTSAKETQEILDSYLADMAKAT